MSSERRHRRNGVLLVLAALVTVAVVATVRHNAEDDPGFAAGAGQETHVAGEQATARELAARLPVTAGIGRPGAVHSALVALRDDAIPALRDALRPGLASAERTRLLNERRSRRYAAARVLAAIDTPASTALLVRCIDDPPDNAAMHKAMLRAVSARALTDDQVVALLGSHQPDVVIAAIQGAAKRADHPGIRSALRRLRDEGALRRQLTDENGRPVGSEANAWTIRLAAGRVLELDMSDEIRARGTTVLDALLAEVDAPPADGDELAWPGYLTVHESALLRNCQALVEMGDVACALVRDARSVADGDRARVLDMVLLWSGDDDRLGDVCATLLEGPPALRVCAAMTLRHAEAEGAKPALWKALRDDLSRPQGGGIEPDREHHPVRVIAAGALIAWGEDVDAVRAASR